MSLTLSAGSSSEYTPHPQGSFAARCVRIVDLGTQANEYKGETTYPKKVILMFETSELMEKGEFAGKPYMISKRYTASTHEKASLRKDLKSWRGRDFTEEEAKEFKLHKVLGVPCMLNIIHSPSKDGTRTYANIAGVTQMPKGLSAPDAVADSYIFDLDKPDMAIFDKLPDRLKETIKASPEWESLAHSRHAPAKTAAPSMPAAPAVSDFNDDDIPF